jgi:hypothetical protein
MIQWPPAFKALRLKIFQDHTPKLLILSPGVLFIKHSHLNFISWLIPKATKNGMHLKVVKMKMVAKVTNHKQCDKQMQGDKQK